MELPSAALRLNSQGVVVAPHRQRALIVLRGRRQELVQLSNLRYRAGPIRFAGVVDPDADTPVRILFPTVS